MTRIFAMALWPLCLSTITYAADDFGLQFHGFVSQGYLLTTGDNYLGDTLGSGTPDFNEVAINVTATPVDRLRIGVQLFARSEGNYGADAPEIDWAYANYHFNDEFGLTAGRFKITHGLYNETRDLDMTRTEVFLPMSVYSERLRDVYLAVNGIQINGSLQSKGLGRLDAILYAGGQNIDSNGAVATQFENGGLGQSFSSITVQRVVGGALTWNTPIDGLRFRGSLLDAHHIQAVGSSQGIVVDPGGGPGGSDVFGNMQTTTVLPDFISGIISAEYQYQDFLVTLEGMREYSRLVVNANTASYINVSGIVPGATIPANLGTTQSMTQTYDRLEGGYLSAAYRIWPKFRVSAARGLNFTDYDHPGAGYTREWSIAASYDILDNWLIKGEWDFVEGTGELDQLENPGGLVRDWQIFAVKTTLDF